MEKVYGANTKLMLVLLVLLESGSVATKGWHFYTNQESNPLYIEVDMDYLL